MTKDELLRQQAAAAIRRQPVPGEYAGYDRRTSDDFARLLVEASRTAGHWTDLPEHLSALRSNLSRLAQAERDLAAELDISLNGLRAAARPAA